MLVIESSTAVMCIIWMGIKFQLPFQLKCIAISY